MRTMAHFKEVQYKLVEKAQKWFSSEWPWSLSVKHYNESRREDRSSASEQTDETTTEQQQRWQPVSPSPQTLYRRQGARRGAKKKRETPKTQRHI